MKTIVSPGQNLVSEKPSPDRSLLSEAVSLEQILVNENQMLGLLGGISQKHAFNLRRQGLLPYVRVGHRIMYRPESLREFARQREQQAVGA